MQWIQHLIEIVSNGRFLKEWNNREVWGNGKVDLFVY